VSATNRLLDWAEGTWRNPPAAAVRQGEHLLVTAEGGSDAWRHTSYGFVHDSAHALLAPMPLGSAVEVVFVLELPEQFDQAGVWLHVSPTHWAKAGVERSDGVAQLGAVVTESRSDWSAAPVPQWEGRAVTVRLSRAGDAVTVRARVDDEPFQLVRLLPLDPTVEASAGPFCASPTRDGLTVRFTTWRTGEPDAALHD
jgi:regulation of enolase protein 1 (concanavalin A-like superfamily)